MRDLRRGVWPAAGAVPELSARLPQYGTMGRGEGFHDPQLASNLAIFVGVLCGRGVAALGSFGQTILRGQLPPPRRVFVMPPICKAIAARSGQTGANVRILGQ